MKKTRTKVTIEIPYEVGTEEFENFMDNLEQMNHDNFSQYTIDVEVISSILEKKIEDNPSHRLSRK